MQQQNKAPPPTFGRFSKSAKGAKQTTAGIRRGLIGGRNFIYRLIFLKMRKLVLLFVFLVSVVGAFAQSNFKVEGGMLYVDKETITLLAEWTKTKDMPLATYVEKALGSERAKEFLTLYASLLPDGMDAERAANCMCVPITVNAAQGREPALPQNSEANTEVRPHVHHGRRNYRHGAAHHLFSSIHTNRRDPEQESSYLSGGPNNSSSWSELNYLYLCIDSNGGLPSCDGCEKKVNIRMHYDAFLQTNLSNTGGLGGGRRTNAQAEDAIALVAFEDNINSFQVLAANQSRLEAFFESDPNNQFLVHLGNLVVSAAQAIFGGQLTSTQIAAIGTNLTNVLTTPSSTVSGASGHQNKIVPTDYSGYISIKPNKLKTVRLLTNSYTTASGYPRKRRGVCYADAKVASDYYLIGAIQHQNSPTCCVNKSAGWVLGAAPEAPTAVNSLRTSVTDYLNIYAPWTTGVPVTVDAGNATAPTQCQPLNCVTINDAVTVSPNVTICQGQSTTLTATNGQTYQWNSTGNTTSSQTAAITVTPTTTTTYSVIVTNGFCSTTKTITVTVMPIPVATISPSVTICQGQTTTLTASGGSTYTWSDDSWMVYPDETPTLTVSPYQTTTYTVAVSNGTCSTTKSVTVTVNPSPTVQIAGSTTVCPNETILLSATTNASTNSLVWNTGQTSPAILTGAGTYIVTATSINSCTATDSHIIFGLLECLDYCPATAIDNAGHISRFKIGTLDNTSTASSYTDYTPTSVTVPNLLRGTTYTPLVSKSIVACNTAAVKVWIDWNQDGDFDDLSETVSNGTTVIVVPTTATLGQTRMRVALNYTCTGATTGHTCFIDADGNSNCDLFYYNDGSLTPCSTDLNGEVEDYTVNIVSALSSNDGFNRETSTTPTSTLTLYPNPTAGSFTVEHPIEITQLEVVDMTGRRVWTGSTNGSNTTTLDISEYPTGVYLVKADNGMIQKVVKQ